MSEAMMQMLDHIGGFYHELLTDKDPTFLLCGGYITLVDEEGYLLSHIDVHASFRSDGLEEINVATPIGQPIRIPGRTICHMIIEALQRHDAYYAVPYVQRCIRNRSERDFKHWDF